MISPTSTTETPQSPEAGLGPPTAGLLLRVRGGEHDGRLICLQNRKCTIGSAPSCTLRLVSTDFHPCHCLIVRGRRGSVIRHWGGATFLNGNEFQDGWLAIGDRVGVGPIELEVVADDTSSLTPERPAWLDFAYRLLESLDIREDELGIDLELDDWDTFTQRLQRRMAVDPLGSPVDLTSEETDLTARRQRLDEQFQQLLASQQELLDKEEQLERARAEIELQGRQQRAESDRLREEERAHFAREQAAWRSNCQELEATLRSEQDQLQAEWQELEQQRNTCHEDQQAKQDAHGTRGDLESRIAELTRLLDSADSQRAQLASQVEFLEEERSELVHHSSVLEARIDQLTCDPKRLEPEASQASDQDQVLAAWINRCSLLEQELDQLQKELAQLQDERQQIQEESSRLREDQSRSSAVYAEKCAALERTRHELADDFSRQLDEVNRQRDLLQLQVSELESELAAARESVQTEETCARNGKHSNSLSPRLRPYPTRGTTRMPMSSRRKRAMSLPRMRIRPCRTFAHRFPSTPR